MLVCVCVLQGLKENMGYLVGDCLLAASFLSYMGPFLSNYRDELLAIWMTQVRTERSFFTFNRACFCLCR